ncbi:MAG: di-trans,poly-cis-decaprenylcistransferase [Deltaproteobacteria bacterium RIFCSPLOWO2_12_FULL_40_28]|nr:MAG: di-trans,poly-cis-decaprenylcistransferase [Deltaproteobacteria bacterium RIFCSPHIGHO2_02_FULL_40_28]OGQ18960.1 MAG: di-trans,poly-cis-decaprenylcistransferase [Deltaproteobacteria bacterium RIFCSPHIGHO2_12_FULL_40_32]OGQ39503.1 MAG: di-trans,poly-cis-decaprenylcistransferase [Deltaproteobacteria bacterium RIFCSPLOWO2_02_FULL_40_36]OGQ53393.1 MAG: di-trans,poly-cis-decaprenylcistransferase [Deltaproteobacteria bacterium RIFCSPLOWO2_12_FULL_40_28]
MENKIKKMPKHVAIIMDGNGRWALKQGLARLEGHRVGVNRSEEIIDCAQEMGIKYLTLYAFSMENWKRPNEEVDTLMMLLKGFLDAKEEKMRKNGICFETIGQISFLPKEVYETIVRVKKSTQGGEKMTLILALSYGSRDEILRAIKQTVLEVKNGKIAHEAIDETFFANCLDTKGIPDPDLVIRTSGEHRISNFLLWQLAYAELFFTDCFWPDFTENHFKNAIEEYQLRERRYGLTSKQIEGTHQK